MNRTLLFAAAVLLSACAGDELPAASEPPAFGGRWVGRTGGLSLALLVERVDADGSFDGQGYLYTLSTSEAFAISGTQAGDSVFVTSDDYRNGTLEIIGELRNEGRNVWVLIDAPPFTNRGLLLERPE